MSKFDKETYRGKLPLWQETPLTTKEELQKVLTSLSLQYALAKVEEHGVLAEQGMLKLDFTNPATLATAHGTASFVEGLRTAIDIILDLAEDTQNDD